MTLGHHFELTFSALKRWFVAQCYDALIVALLWLAALCYLRIPLAAFWAILGGLLQFVPHFGPLLALLGPTVALLFARAEWAQYAGLLIAYAGIALVDGLFLQPYLMHRQNRVHPGAAAAGVPDPVLGSVPGSAAVGRYLCLCAPPADEAGDGTFRRRHRSSAGAASQAESHASRPGSRFHPRNRQPPRGAEVHPGNQEVSVCLSRRRAPESLSFGGPQ